MLQIVSLLVVLVLSLIITRVATIALTLTGLSRPVARFQARSALTGAGFTTHESENVVSHPVRRRIIMWLMITGNIGLVIAASLVIVIIGGESENISASRMVLLLVGLGLLWWASLSVWVDRWLSRAIEYMLHRYTDLDTRDYAGLLRLRGAYTVVEMYVKKEDWLAGRTLQQLRLSAEGVLVLGVERCEGKFLGAPRGETKIHAGDTLLLYGRHDVLDKIDKRRGGSEGNWAHFQSVAEQKRHEQAESEDDKDV